MNLKEAVDKSSNQFKDWCPQVMERAKEIQANLSPEHPSFIKVMKKAHVSNSFYMCPPMQFCQKHLPKTDKTIVLEIESGKSYEVKFLGSNCAFSAGWRGFAIAEKLLENDVLVFHLIGPCKFKVYIVRAKEFAPVDKAPTVSETDGFATKREEKERTCERDKKSEAHFTGVVKIKSGRYRAEIRISGRTMSLGTFDTAKEAAIAFDLAARELRGPQANTNFPDSNTTVDSSLLSPQHHRDIKNVNKVRASELTAADKAATFIEIDDFATEREVEKNQTCERDRKLPRFVSQRILQEKVAVSDSSLKNSIHPDDSNSLNLEGFQPSKCVSDLKNFKVKVDGTTIELPQQVRANYYKLCCSQKSYLHRNLIKGIDPELAASVISGTVNIASALRESKISAPRDEIEYWNKALDGFEVFGMNIGFIRARLVRLSGLTLNLKRYKEAESERECVEKKIIELKKRKRRLDEEIEGVGKFEAMYEEEASFPW